MAFADVIQNIKQGHGVLREHAANALLHEGAQALEQTTARALGHLRSPTLRQIETQVILLRDTPTAQRAADLLDTIDRWRSAHPQEVEASGVCPVTLTLAVVSTVLAPATQRLLSRIDADLDLPAQHRAPAVRQTALQWEAALHPSLREWVNLDDLHNAVKVPASLAPHMPALKAIGKYACTDLLTYSASASPRKIAQGKEKLAAFEADPERVKANLFAITLVNAASINLRSGTLTMDKIEAIARRVHQAQAGCCSTMAYAAVAEVLREPAVSERVELVAYRGAKRSLDAHCYLVLGRDENSELSDPATWGPQAQILDPWAVTLGGKLMSSPDRPPLPNMFPPTESIWERPALQTDV